MKKNEHTPGPWHPSGTRSDAPSYVMAGDGEGSAVAICPHLDGEDRYCEHVANASLIAAAPDLLAACEWSLSMMAGGRPEEDIAHLRAAIKKARGTP